MRSSETKRSVRPFLSPHQFGDHVNLEDKSLRSAICVFIRDSWNAQPCLRIIVIKTCYLISICPFMYLALISQISVNSAVLLVRVPPLRVGAHLMTSSPAAHRPRLILWFTLFRDAGTCVNFMPFVLLLCLGLSLFFPFFASRFVLLLCLGN